MDNTRNSEIVELEDGRKVKVVETTGFDEMIAAKVIGKEMDKFGSGAVQLRYVNVAFAIKEIDEQPVKRPTTINEVRTFMAKFTSKQIGKLSKAYSKLNEYKEDEEENEGVPEGEELADESNI
jgi:hypothetical protein